MSIVKKLPAVLIAAVGISLGFAGTALTEEPIFAEQTLGPDEELVVQAPGKRNTKICFKATDNLEPLLFILNMANPRNPELLMFPYRMEGRRVTRESDYQCVSFSSTREAIRPPNVTVQNIGILEAGHSQSVHVYARQE
jgi:hypothetical protein